MLVSLDAKLGLYVYVKESVSGMSSAGVVEVMILESSNENLRSSTRGFAAMVGGWKSENGTAVSDTAPPQLHRCRHGRQLREITRRLHLGRHTSPIACGPWKER